MDEKELEILIPSGYVRNYIKESGWAFTDREKASLLCHADIPWRERCQRMKDLQQRTHDGELKRIFLHILTKQEWNMLLLKKTAAGAIFIS